MWQVTSTGSKATGARPFLPSCCRLLSPLPSHCSPAPQLLLFAGLAAYMGQPCLFSSWLPCHGIGLMRLLPLLPTSVKEVCILAVKRHGCVEAHDEERRLQQQPAHQPNAATQSRLQRQNTHMSTYSLFARACLLSRMRAAHAGQVAGPGAFS